MFACTGCTELWGAWLSACPRCKAPLRRWGTEEADFDHPVLAKFPMRKAMAQQLLGSPLAAELPPSARPKRRRSRRKPPAEPAEPAGVA